MDKLNSGDVAIVFWTHGSRGQRGEVTRFDCLKDAIQAVMDSPLSKSAPIAWIRTADRHFMMNDIRQMAGGRTLASRLAPVAASAVETAKSPRPARAKRFWWPGPAELGSGSDEAAEGIFVRRV